MKKLFCVHRQSVWALALAIVVTGWVTGASAKPWKFGVMGDTQWTTADPAGTNPYTVPVSIIDQVEQQFINAGVKFVIEVGDLTDDGNDISETTRANAAQALYNAGIGFFPMRGNHETYGSGNSYAMPIFKTSYPQTQCVGPHVFGAHDCTSPTLPNPNSTDLLGLSYSFDYGRRGNNARFVIIDPWVTPSVDVNAAGYDFGWSIAQQQGWINDRINKMTRGAEHVFVFSHQPLIAENHQDCMFQGYTNANPSMQNAFYASLQNNGVAYYISGHDHIHQRSLVVSPDSTHSVHEQICASNSSKFYTPKTLDNPSWFGQKSRETSLSQEKYTVGYYIYTVDGPRVTVDYYSDSHGNWLSDANYPDGTNDLVNYPLNVTPVFNFVKKETWGYSQNGKEILVAQGGSYVLTDDTLKALLNGEGGYVGTKAQILNGTNNSTARDGSLNTTGGVGRELTKAVDTGWAPRNEDTISDIFFLWGLGELGATTTDTYAVSVSFEPRMVREGVKHVFLATRDGHGHWVKAGNNFVVGPYESHYSVGTYGVDPKTKTAWAVTNQVGGEFAVMQGYPEHEKWERGDHFEDKMF
ncbi:MAG TPA: metallophosphoesterase [Syntrophorhabdaceae bacterium]|nr:metallophosphoesterase [Syntrophorhabdaceae bacterium]